MKRIIVFILVLLLLSPSVSSAASAKCEVIKKQGNVLVMDCGQQADGFNEKSQVKIKTDRGQRDGQGK